MREPRRRKPALHRRRRRALGGRALASLPRLSPAAARGARRRARSGDSPVRRGHRSGAARERRHRSVRRADHAAAADSERQSPSSSSRRSRAHRIRSSSTPACARRAGRRSCCACSWTRCREGGIAPTAEAARHVERIGARSVGRSIRLRLRRLPEHAGRLADALAVLEQGDLLQAARLAGLDDVEAAERRRRPGDRRDPRAGPAADVQPPDRPQRNLRRALQRRACAGPPRCGPAARRASRAPTSASPSTCWSASRRATSGSSSGWSTPHARRGSGCSRGGGGLPASSARRAAPAGRAVGVAARPRHGRGERRPLRLGRAPAGGRRSSRRTPRRPPTRRMVLAHALSRAQRFAEAVEVLDRAAASLDLRGLRRSRSSSRPPRSSPRMNGPVQSRRRSPAAADAARARRRADRGAAARAAGRRRVHLRPRERARRGRRGPRDRALSRREARGAGFGRQAVVLVRSVVLAGDVHAALGRAVRAAAAAARRLDLAGAGERRQQSARAWAWPTVAGSRSDAAISCRRS